MIEQSSYNFHYHPSACSNGHLQLKDDKEIRKRYFTCIKCNRYNISQPYYYCIRCKEAGCFAFCTEEKDEPLGKKNLNC